MATSTLSPAKVTFGYLLWWLLMTIVETYALINTFHFEWTMALADAVNINLLIATAGYIVHNSLKYYRPSIRNFVYVIGGIIVLSAGCVYLHEWLMIRYIYPNDLAYKNYLELSTLIRGLVAWMMIALMAIVSWIWFYLQDQRAAEQREQDMVKMARETELSTLRQQLQPHFLFNSLNSISALVGTQPERARLMIQQLSDFLRGTIKRDDQHLITLQEELHHLQLYLEIEKVRFGHRLKTEITKTDETLSLKLPSLLLQPVVENAIKFGLYDTTGDIVISIDAALKENALMIRVENPFDSGTSQPRQGTGFGLTGIQRRLYLLYARNDLLRTKQSEHNTFITEVTIPQPA